MSGKLTQKQKKFADEYIISGNATESARKAGYSESTAGAIGHENLTKPKIREYIDKRLEEHEDEQIAKQDEILKFLTSVMRGELREEQLSSGTGYAVEMSTSIKDRIKASELLGKRHAMWTDRVEQTNRNITVEVGDWDDE
ncbi:terminase small subunit [Dolosigranulum pigrum]